jgi:hypothetical protein
MTRSSALWARSARHPPDRTTLFSSQSPPPSILQLPLATQINSQPGARYLNTAPGSMGGGVEGRVWKRNYVQLEVLTAVVQKSSIFWNITPCSPQKFNRCFGGTYRLYLQGERISHARNNRESLFSTCFPLVSCLVYSSTLKTDETCSFETLVDFKRNTWRFIPDDTLRKLSGSAKELAEN